MTLQQIQCLLQYLGYYTITVDGIWGPGSEQATKDFQVAEGLEDDGIPGKLTQAALLDAVADEGQVWTLIQPHDAAEYQGRPSTLRALWGLCHMTNPAKAKPWVDAYGTSGLYKKGECYLHSDGTVRRCLVEETNFSADAMPSYWETVEVS